MGEDIDQTQMCQSLMDKVSQSEQLKAITDADVMMLFEDWLEELEKEVLSLLKEHGDLNEQALARKIGLSDRGATFLLSKLKKEGKI